MTSPTIALLGMNDFYRAGMARLLSQHGFRVLDRMVETPDLALFDGGIGVTLTMAEAHEVLRRHPATRIVILNESLVWNAADILNAFRHGISAYFVQPHTEAFIKSLELLLVADELVVPRCAMMTLAKDEGPAPVLSKREVEVIGLLAKGLSNKAIGRTYGLTDSTVKVHVKAILRKLRLANRTQAAVWGVKFLATLNGKASMNDEGPYEHPLLVVDNSKTPSLFPKTAPASLSLRSDGGASES
jgi:two-component system nitrate/nitrite response regulator NarL